MPGNGQYIDQLMPHVPVLTHIHTLGDTLPRKCNYPQPPNFKKTLGHSIGRPQFQQYDYEYHAFAQFSASQNYLKNQSGASKMKKEHDTYKWYVI